MGTLPGNSYPFTTLTSGERTRQLRYGRATLACEPFRVGVAGALDGGGERRALFASGPQNSVGPELAFG